MPGLASAVLGPGQSIVKASPSTLIVAPSSRPINTVLEGSGAASGPLTMTNMAVNARTRLELAIVFFMSDLFHPIRSVSDFTLPSA
jgi:hypothetical protein